MATDIYCPHHDCKYIRRSGLCGQGVLALEATPHDNSLTCTDYEKRTPPKEAASHDLH